ncbi:MAG: response regulator transcription factor [Bacteroidetes bacterium]|nr:response regulator transcription factor [Bacteroidota bacterium]
MIRVALVDDHTIVREGLKKILALEPDFTVVGESGSAEGALELIEKVLPDILLLDISLPGRSGLDIIHDLKQLAPGMGILVLTMHPEQVLAVRSLKAGASGYLNKDAASEELVRAVRRIHAGGRYITASVADHLLFAFQNPSGNAHEQLSDREFQVMLLIARGRKNRMIADELTISPRTVGTYRARILEKLNLETTADIIRYAFDNGLLSDSV